MAKTTQGRDKVRTVKRSAPRQFTRREEWRRYCSRCGLLLLKNDATRRAAKAPCEWEDVA